MEAKTKAQNFQLVRETIKSMDQTIFTNNDIVKITGLNYDQVKRILTGLTELEEIKYSESTRLYVRDENE